MCSRCLVHERKPVAVSVVCESPLVADAVGHVEDVGVAELHGPSSSGSRSFVLVRQHEGLVELENLKTKETTFSFYWAEMSGAIK